MFNAVAWVDWVVMDGGREFHSVMVDDRKENLYSTLQRKGGMSKSFSST